MFITEFSLYLLYSNTYYFQVVILKISFERDLLKHNEVYINHRKIQLCTTIVKRQKYLHNGYFFHRSIS